MPWPASILTVLACAGSKPECPDGTLWDTDLEVCVKVSEGGDGGGSGPDGGSGDGGTTGTDDGGSDGGSNDGGGAGDGGGADGGGDGGSADGGTDGGTDGGSADEPVVDADDHHDESIIDELDWEDVQDLDEADQATRNARYVGIFLGVNHELSPEAGEEHAFRCSATLVSPTLVLTNEHCVDGSGTYEVDGVEVEYTGTYDEDETTVNFVFYDEDQYSSRSAVESDGWRCHELVESSVAEDAALVRCAPEDNDGQVLAEALGGWVDLPLSWSPALAEGDDVYLIHQNCGDEDTDCSSHDASKKYSPGEVTDFPAADYTDHDGAGALEHTCDTKGGSSGGMVFAESTHAAVGLHHMGHEDGNHARYLGTLLYNEPDFVSAIEADIADWSDIDLSPVSGELSYVDLDHSTLRVAGTVEALWGISEWTLVVGETEIYTESYEPASPGFSFSPPDIDLRSFGIGSGEHTLALWVKNVYGETGGGPVDVVEITHCIEESTTGCYGGDVYWYDSCGELGERYRDCTGDEECSVESGSPSCDSTCEPGAWEACLSGDVYSFDSCGVAEGVFEYCDSGTECIESGDTASCETDCSADTYERCSGDDVVTYDLCGDVVDIEYCDSDESCEESGDTAWCEAGVEDCDDGVDNDGDGDADCDDSDCSVAYESGPDYPDWTDETGYYTIKARMYVSGCTATVSVEKGDGTDFTVDGTMYVKAYPDSEVNIVSSGYEEGDSSASASFDLCDYMPDAGTEGGIWVLAKSDGVTADCTDGSAAGCYWATRYGTRDCDYGGGSICIWSTCE